MVRFANFKEVISKTGCIMIIDFFCVFRFHFRLLLCFIVLISNLSYGQGNKGNAGAADRADKDASRFFAGVSLLSNYAHYGLTQTQNDPALQTEFGYQLKYLRLGIWGSNVKFLGGTEHLNLQPYADYKMIFTDNLNAQLKVVFSSYYSSNQRNGVNIIFDMNIYDYHLFIEKEGKWQGTNYEARHMGVYKDWNLSDYLFRAKLFSNNISDSPGFKDYLSSELYLGYKWDPVKIYLIGSYATEASQFSGGQGDPMLILAVYATF